MSPAPREPVDQAARDKALDPLASYCVSAPAGSGKTALLVKRFLVLLARCHEPENVVAITFTRKAAAEMRGRIIEALRNADSGVEPGNDHEQQLQTLARAVLARDRERGWELQAMPGRLTIRTIDSFCAELSRQMPILSGAGGPVQTTDFAAPLYREAVERFLHRQLQSADDSNADLRLLMLHLDNRWDTAVDLLAGLLSRREQWQPVFGGTGFDGGERQGLQDVARAVVDERLDKLRDHLESHLHSLDELLVYRGECLKSPTKFVASSNALEGWRELTEVLLTQSDEWRKSVNKSSGFPAGKGRADEYRQAMIALLSELRSNDDGSLRRALAQLRVLPDPEGDPRHWAVLSAVTRLLPRLGAELLLVFKQRGEVDHAQVALAAIASLGGDARPTDVALRLDFRIEHLLVDEFQDTSSLQFELVRRLTRGWHEHNGGNPQAPRTLFLVGDAMQSIYGFREANVGLFIRAREEGIGDLLLTPLNLSVNFRSAGGLVRWSNDTIAPAFPRSDDSQVGAVCFRTADWWRDAEGGADVRLFAGDQALEAEIDALCERLGQGLADDAVGSMAVLGRSRTHLRPVLAALRERGLPFAGQDLEPLGRRPVIRDLLTLCQVLSDPFDRLAWLSLLRCPIAALDHGDLLIVANHLPVAHAAKNAGLQDLALTPIGYERLAHVRQVLLWAEQYRHRLALRVWVEECWLRLGGDAALRDSAEAEDGEQFLQLLESLDQRGLSMNQQTLNEGLESLYASPGAEHSKLQVMTLHKAKGLEFDEVFIPALARGTAGQDRDLLLWDEMMLPDGATSFLLDVRAGADVPPEPQLYDFLHDQGREKRRLESNRLFYVGCTRAADYLWLSAALGWDERNDAPRTPQKGSLLTGVWDQLRDAVPVTHCPGEPEVEDSEPLSYRRLSTLPTLETMDSGSPAHTRMPVDSRHARAFGTAVHRCLEALVYREQLPPNVDPTLRELLRVSLLASGADALESLLERGVAALNRVLDDSFARRMLSPERVERHAELALTLLDDDRELNLVLDYVFVDERSGDRWVVDYKTAAPAEHEVVDDFMDMQCEHYAEQLRGYRRALEECFPEPVRCALYFTALGTHREVDA